MLTCTPESRRSCLRLSSCEEGAGGLGCSRKVVGQGGGKRNKTTQAMNTLPASVEE